MHALAANHRRDEPLRTVADANARLYISFYQPYVVCDTVAADRFDTHGVITTGVQILVTGARVAPTIEPHVRIMASRLVV